MKQKAYQDNKIKHQLRNYETSGKKELLWKLKPEQVAYIQGLGYQVDETLFYIHTKAFPDLLRKKYPIINELHISKIRKGKSFIVKKLSKKEKEILRDFGVSFSVAKYTIKLQRQMYH
jgi:hypothetical protein